jgi:hypothetical protein
VSLNNVFAEMRSLVTDWDGVLLNPRWVRRDNELTWEERSGLWLPTRMTREALADVARRGQYSFQIDDGSLLQMWYLFAADKTTLRSATLGYYRNEPSRDAEVNAPRDQQPGTELAPDHEVTADNGEPADGAVEAEVEGSEVEQTDDGEVVTTEVDAANDPLAWLRIDYDPSAFRGCIHEKCHMHVSLSGDMRVGVRGVPSPRQFVEAVMSWFYPDEYEARHLDDQGKHKDGERVAWVNSTTLVDTSRDPERTRLMHIGVVGG